MVAGRNQDAVDELTASTPLRRRADPEDVGWLAMFLLSDEASFVTGSVYRVDAGMF